MGFIKCWESCAVEELSASREGHCFVVVVFKHGVLCCHRNALCGFFSPQLSSLPVASPRDASLWKPSICWDVAVCDKPITCVTALLMCMSTSLGAYPNESETWPCLICFRARHRLGKAVGAVSSCAVACMKWKEMLRSAHTVYLCVLYTALTDCLWGVFYEVRKKEPLMSWISNPRPARLYYAARGHIHIQSIQAMCLKMDQVTVTNWQWRWTEGRNYSCALCLHFAFDLVNIRYTKYPQTFIDWAQVS